MLYLTIKQEPLSLITQKGLSISGLGTFVSSLGSPVYGIEVRSDGSLQQIILKDSLGSVIYVSRLPFGQVRTVLLPHGESIILDVTTDPLSGSGVTLRT